MLKFRVSILISCSIHCDNYYLLIAPFPWHSLTATTQAPALHWETFSLRLM